MYLHIQGDTKFKIIYYYYEFEDVSCVMMYFESSCMIDNIKIKLLSETFSLFLLEIELTLLINAVYQS